MHDCDVRDNDGIVSLPGEANVEGDGNVTPSCFSSSVIMETRRNGGVKSTSNTCIIMMHDIQSCESVLVYILDGDKYRGKCIHTKQSNEREQH